MTLGDRMWVTYWALLVMSVVDSAYWLIYAVIVFAIGVWADRAQDRHDANR